MTRIYPRIPDEAAMATVEELQSGGLAHAESLVQYHHPRQVFPPVGGREVTEAELQALRTAVVDLAELYGFPGRRPRRTALFDRELAGLLHSQMDITPHEAASREMWSFITCCLLPDVAVWRFPKVTPNRFLGHVNRNAFRRLWWRVEILGEPPERDVPDPLWDLEDPLVQLMERPGLSGHPEVARAIADAFRKVAARVPGNRHQDLMRDFQLRIMRRTPFLSLDLIDQAGRERLLAGLAEEAADALGVAGVSQRETKAQGLGEASSSSAEAASSTAAVDIDDVPLDDLPRVILETVEEEQPVADDDLPDLIAARGFQVPRSRERLLFSFVRYLAAKQALQRTDDGVWRVHRSVSLPSVCPLSINGIATEALSQAHNGQRHQLFEQIADEVLTFSGKVPSPYARAIRAALRKVDLG